MLFMVCCGTLSQVRISLDTNLAMVREDTCGYARLPRACSVPHVTSIVLAGPYLGLVLGSENAL